jgi:tRNA pseudouridine38-40 synthase
LKDALNFYLPDDIVLRGLKTVQDSFNARYDVTSKKYRYTIYTGETRPIFDAKYAYWCRRKLNISRMRKAAKFIIGEHDFTSFSSNHDERESKVLKISSIKVKKVRDYVTIDFAANRFLRNMIRIIVGTLIDVGAGKTESRDMRDIVNSKDRRSAGATASAKGLTLVEVCY